MKSKFTVCAVAFVLLLLPLNIVTIRMVNVQAPEINIDPSIVTVKVFDGFTVGINVTGVTDLGGFDIKLYWNNSLVNATSYDVRAPTEWSNYIIAVSSIENAYNATHGRYWLAIAAIPTSLGFTGSHKFVDLSFECLGIGGCTLELTDTVLTRWITGDDIPHEVNDGYVIQESRTPILYIEPANVTVVAGEDFRVNVSIAYALDLYCFDFKLSYNATLLDCIEIAKGDFFDPIKSITFTHEINDTIGRVWFVGSLLNNASLANGNGTLATMNFHCTGPGECLLDLYDTILLSMSAQPVSPPPYVGDVDGSLFVDMKDVVMVVIVYGTESGDPDYNATRDLNNDGSIDLFDLVMVTINFVHNYTIPDDALLPTDNDIVHYVVDANVTQYTMLPHGPTAIFTATPIVLPANQSVAFDASFSLPGSDGFEVCPIVEYAWDFETDGIVDSYGVNQNHNFTEAGYYTVTLNVTDSQGLWDIESKVVTALSPRPPEEVKEAGLAYLASQQNPDGSWGYWDEVKPAYTGLVLTKLQMHAYESGYGSPFDQNYLYSNEIVLGWKYVFGVNATGSPLYAFKYTLSVQNHAEGASGTMDDPDSNGNGYGICFGYSSGDPNLVAHSTYTTGIALMALEASGTPGRPNEGGIDFNSDGFADTFQQFAQDMADWLSWAQGDSGNDEGGWGYEPLNDQVSEAWTDNSNSGYATLGIAAAKSFGCTVPDWVKIEINVWITNIQDPVNGDPDDGGSYYDPGSPSMCNELKTGNLIFQMAFSGDPPTTLRFQNALDYIARHWTNASIDPGWGYGLFPSNYQAMFCLMKGFEYSKIDLIDLDGDDVAEHDWFEEFKTVLASQQYPNGSWLSGLYGDSVIDTAWALLTLEKATPQYAIADIATTNVSTSKTVVGQGYNASLSVTVENQGNYTETFNLTVYANETIIETKEVTLTSGNSTTITFTWNTTGFAYGNYTISAYAWPVLGETNTVDNTFVDGWVVVTSHGWELDFTLPTNHPIVDFAVYNGSLYAAADNKLYVKNGSSWNVIDAPTFVTSLETYGGKLVVGGQDGLYCYDEASFGLIFSVPTYIKVLGAYDNKLYAGTMLDNPPKLYYCNGSADNPSDWYVDADFSAVLSFSGAFGSIDSFAVCSDVMYIASGGSVYSFNGTEWNLAKIFTDVYSVLDMQVYNGKLYLATRDQGWRKPFYQGGTGFSGRVIEYDGENWTTVLDHDYWVYSLEEYDGKLYAGTANKILTYNGTDWETSFNATEGAYYAISMITFDGKIYAGMGNGYIFADPAPLRAEQETITVPEFSSTTILAVFMALTMLAAALTRKKRTKRFC